MIKSAVDIDEIFKLYYRPLCMYILHYVHDIDTAEDIAQDCFMAFLEKMVEGKKEIENIKAYLYTIAHNRSLDYLNKEPLHVSLTETDVLEEFISNEEIEECSFIEARMWTAIDALPDRCREIFLLNKRDGMRYKEIAEKLQISVNTVDNHISKALRLVREGVHKVYLFLFN